MELPIVATFDETLASLDDQNLIERVRILDIDGAYVISVWVLEKTTRILKNFSEVAFSTLPEAIDYVHDELDIDMTEEETNEKEWVDYDAD